MSHTPFCVVSLLVVLWLPGGPGHGWAGASRFAGTDDAAASSISDGDELTGTTADQNPCPVWNQSNAETAMIEQHFLLLQVLMADNTVHDDFERIFECCEFRLLYCSSFIGFALMP